MFYITPIWLSKIQNYTYLKTKHKCRLHDFHGISRKPALGVGFTHYTGTALGLLNFLERMWENITKTETGNTQLPWNL